MNLRIWKLGADCNKDVNIRTSIDYFRSHFVAEPMLSDWCPPPIRIEGKSKRLRDFVSWMNSAPVVSEKGRQALEPLLSGHCELLPLIELRGKPYYALNVLTKVDCLDHANSQILYANDDPMHILRIKSYGFNEDQVPPDIPIFKIPDDVGSVFVTRTFVDAVIASELRGASFEDPRSDPFGKIARGEPLNVVPGLSQ